MNKHIDLANRYLAAVQAMDLEAIPHLLAPDFSYQLLPSTSFGNASEPTNVAGLLAIVQTLKSQLKDGRLPMEILDIVDASAADMVVVRSKPNGAITNDGAQYTQEYLFILWMRDVDGELKVVRAQESVDSALAKAFFSRIQ